MSTMLTYLWIGAGGALGSMGRFWFGSWVAARHVGAFPLGTLLINIIGSIAIGFFAAFSGSAGRWPLDQKYRDFFMAGVCGGFTTFSAFSLQTLTLAQGGEWLKAGLYVVLSVLLCLLGVWLGHLLAVAVNR